MCVYTDTHASTLCVIFRFLKCFTLTFFLTLILLMVIFGDFHMVLNNLQVFAVYILFSLDTED